MGITHKSGLIFAFILLHGTTCNAASQDRLKSRLEALLENVNASGMLQAEDPIDHELPPATGLVRKAVSTNRVAFHVYMSRSRCYNNREILKFDRKVVDIGSKGGSGFNMYSGIYVAPTTGLYVFTWTVAAEHRTWFVSELEVNGAVKGITKADSDVKGNGVGTHPVTGFVLAQVISGDHVYIRFIRHTGCTVKSDSSNRSTFTGWQMF
ncbi:uncharacterized protein LOC123541582 [Mercenaria mercenaria]|uniref:uncharacterized protein LOC123541582 n=1 Tax=Mercenaria mercenaria TaxID=6596 RepID=UPI00234EA406|nr:uncharacterized protein LOC123541582 [Mercenaria mercenaria]